MTGSLIYIGTDRRQKMIQWVDSLWFAAALSFHKALIITSLRICNYELFHDTKITSDRIRSQPQSR